jgi:alpha-1,3-glucan synthase
MNVPWNSDSYSPLDFTLLDKHFGDIATWRSAVDEVHKRGMYVILDHTMSTYVLLWRGVYLHCD